MKNARAWQWAAALACALAPWLGAQAQSVAMALDRSGEVEVTHAARTVKLKLLDYLASDSELRVPAAGSATLVYLATSQEWQFEGPGRYALQPGQPRVLEGKAPKVRGVAAASAQAMTKMEPTQRDRLALGAVVLRAAGPLRMVGPNNVDVLAARPTLIWRSSTERPVRVSVFVADAAAPLAQAVVADRQWTPPTDLSAGSYDWQAELATGPAGPPLRGRFRVIEAGDERRARLGPAPAATAPFSQRLAYALMLDNEDLPHDALLWWRVLAAERPDEASLRDWAR